jgi:hypothetical protein
MDIVSEMSLGGGPDSDAPEDDSQQELETMPDLFAKVRPLLMTAEGEPRLLVRAAPWLVLFIVLGMPCAFLSLGVDPDRPILNTQIEVTRGAFMGVPFGGGLLFLPLMCRVIQPETGALAQLGVGKTKVPVRQIKQLRRWQFGMGAAGAGIALWFFVGPFPITVQLIMNVFGLLEFEDFTPAEIGQVMKVFEPVLWIILPMIISMGPSLVIGYPVAMQWYVSMKVAVTLAQDDVAAVTQHTKPDTLLDDKVWSTRVAQPAISLATNTMAHLSAGYSLGAGWTAFMCAWISLANFVAVVHSIRMRQYDNVPRQLSATILAAMAPFVIASDLAHVSTRW